MRRERNYPPNCTVCDLNPSRFLAFREKQDRVEAEYGFRLSVPRRTESERDGYRRYMRDWHRRYRATHRDKLAAYRHDYWQNVTKRGFDSLAEANGDEETLKRKAAKKARKEYEERKRQVHEQYGFWLNTPPKTPEEEAGRARYRKDQDAARKERNHDKIVAYQKAHNAKQREENERKFLAKLKQMEAEDPVAAEKFKAKHEKMCRIQRMSHEERVRYRQQKQFERLKAQAEREAALAEARRVREERRAEEQCISRAEKRRKREETARLARVARMLEIRQEREATEAAMKEAEQIAIAAYAAECAANREAYLAAKASAKDDIPEPVAEPEPPIVSDVFVIEPPSDDPPSDNVALGDDGDDDAEELRRKRLEELRLAVEAQRQATHAAKKGTLDKKERLREYNREYRKRRRVEELAARQSKWSAAEWAEWEARQKAKERGHGTPAWLVEEVVKFIASKTNLAEDAVSAWILEHGGVDFLSAGAEAMGRKKLKGSGAVAMAARALMFYIDPDTARMF